MDDSGTHLRRTCRAIGVRITALSLAAVVVACSSLPGEDQALQEQVYAAFDNASAGDTVDLASVLVDDRRTLYAFEGDPLPETIKEATGISWDGYTPESREGTTLVWVADGTVVRSAYLPPVIQATSGRKVQIEFGPAGWIRVAPPDTAFVVKSRQDDGPIRICQGTCASP